MRSIPLAFLLLAACSDSQSVGDAIGNSGQAGDAREAAANAAGPLNPGTVAVRVGEGGPGFPACQSTGIVSGTGALMVRGAPFAEGTEVDRLPAATRVAVCTRSLDQRWLGIVYPAVGGDLTGCGTDARLERRQGYEGPCRSGWVASAFIRLVGR